MRKKRPQDWSEYKYLEEINKRQDTIDSLEQEIEQLEKWMAGEENG